MTARDPDPGTARSRTLLAWQRTALSAAAGTLLLLRLGYDDAGPVVLLGLLALPPVVWLAWPRRRSTSSPGSSSGSSPGSSATAGLGPGPAGALLAAAVVALCLTELLVLADPS